MSDGRPRAAKPSPRGGGNVTVVARVAASPPPGAGAVTASPPTRPADAAATHGTVRTSTNSERRTNA
jgi:hypothetical protein